MTEQNLWSGARADYRGRDPQLRASDGDRDAVAESLRAQHAEGRLDIEDLQNRIDRCYDAKTLGELDQLLVDLPRESSAQTRPGWLLGQPRVHLLWLAPVIVMLAAISAVTGAHLIWLAIPAVFIATRRARTQQM